MYVQIDIFKSSVSICEHVIKRMIYRIGYDYILPQTALRCTFFLGNQISRVEVSCLNIESICNKGKREI